MTIRLKYCGGCNPRYDREQLARRLRLDFPQARLFGQGEGLFDVVAVICGCAARCAGHEELQGRCGKAVLADSADYEKLRALCRECELRGEG